MANSCSRTTPPGRTSVASLLMVGPGSGRYIVISRPVIASNRSSVVQDVRSPCTNVTFSMPSVAALPVAVRTGASCLSTLSTLPEGPTNSAAAKATAPGPGAQIEQPHPGTDAGPAHRVERGRAVVLGLCIQPGQLLVAGAKRVVSIIRHRNPPPFTRCSCRECRQPG